MAKLKKDSGQELDDLVMRTDSEPELKQESDDPVEAACEAYGIDRRFLMGSRVHPDRSVTLVTAGGAKVTRRHGETVRPLSAISVTGINPENDRRKPITGGKR